MVCKEKRGGPGVARDGSERRMGAVTPGETLGTYTTFASVLIKTKEHLDSDTGGGKM